MGDSFKMTNYNQGEMTADQTRYLATHVPDHKEGPAASE